MTNSLSLHFAVYSRLKFLPEHTIVSFSTLVTVFILRVGEHNFHYYYYYYYYTTTVIIIIIIIIITQHRQ